MNGLSLPQVFDLHDMSFWYTKEMLRIIGISSTEYALKHPNVHKLLHGENTHYDLILVEQFFQDAFLVFGQKFKAPIVSICKLNTIYVGSVFNVCIICSNLRLEYVFRLHAWIIWCMGTYSTRASSSS